MKISMSYSIDTSTKFNRVTYAGTLENNDIQGVLKDALVLDGDGFKLTNHIEDMRKLKGIKIGFAELMDFTKNFVLYNYRIE